MAGEYRFSFGPWNIHEGADPFGPTVRRGITFARKLKLYKKLGFDGVQFHDDDAVPDMNDLSPKDITKKAAEVRKMLDDEGLTAEFVAPRLWEDPADDRRRLHVERSEGPQVRHRAQPSCDRHRRRPGDQADRPVAGPRRHLHPRGQGQQGRRGPAGRRDQRDAGLRPGHQDRHRAQAERADGPRLHPHDGPRPGPGLSDRRTPSASASSSRRPTRFWPGWTRRTRWASPWPATSSGRVHLNDQNGLKFDQDKSFGSVDLRRAFNQVRILDKYNYGKTGEFVGLDVKAMRTQKQDAGHQAPEQQPDHLPAPRGPGPQPRPAQGR